eukprot:symbB.v1.2.012074.t1/scaffold822.1/size350215/1
MILSRMTLERLSADWKSRMPILSSYSRSFLWQQSHDLIWQLRRVKIRIDQTAMCAAMTGSSKAQCWRESLELMPRCPDDLSLAAVCGYGEVWKKTIQNHWGEPRMGSMATTASDNWTSSLSLMQKATLKNRLHLTDGFLVNAVSVLGNVSEWEAASITLTSTKYLFDHASSDVGFGAAVASLRGAKGLWIKAFDLLKSSAHRGIQSSLATRNAAVATASGAWTQAISLSPTLGRAEVFGITCPWQKSLQLIQVHVLRCSPDEITRHACLAALEIDPGDWMLALHLLRWPPFAVGAGCWVGFISFSMTAHLRSGQTMTGMVKSYNRRGFGFIMCQAENPGKSRAIEQDIYFSRESLHPNLQTSDLAGEQIQFEIHRFHDGKLQARNLRALGDVSDFKGSSYGANRQMLGIWVVFIFTPTPGEMIQFDDHIFQMD